MGVGVSMGMVSRGRGRRRRDDGEDGRRRRTDRRMWANCIGRRRMAVSTGTGGVWRQRWEKRGEMGELQHDRAISRSLGGMEVGGEGQASELGKVKAKSSVLLGYCYSDDDGGMERRATQTQGHGIDDHSLVVDDDCSWAWDDGSAGSAGSLADDAGFSSVITAPSFCSDWCDAPSSTSMSCAREESAPPTQQVQMFVMRSNSEILRRFVVDCLLLLVGVCGALEAFLPLECEPPLPVAIALKLFRRDRRLWTGTVTVDAAQRPASFSLLAQDA